MLFSLAACSGAKVLETADGESRPKWVSTTKTSWKEGEKMFWIGYVSVDGASSPSAALNMADLKATSSPGAAIADEFMDQNALGEDLRDATGKRLISSLRKRALPLGVQIVGRYWERVAIPSGNGGPDRVELRAFALAEAQVHEFEAAKSEGVRRLRGDPEIKKELEEITKAQRETERKPASAQ